MAYLIAFPIFTALLIFQMAVVSQLPLLRGTPDLVLLAVTAWALQKRASTAWHWGIIAGFMVGIATALPFPITLINYVLAVGLAMMMRRGAWRFPILAMLLCVLVATVATQAVTLVALRLVGNPIPILAAVNLVTLPSILMNLLLAIPIFALLADLAGWLYPEELEV